MSMKCKWHPSHARDLWHWNIQRVHGKYTAWHTHQKKPTTFQTVRATLSNKISLKSSFRPTALEKKNKKQLPRLNGVAWNDRKILLVGLVHHRSLIITPGNVIDKSKEDRCSGKWKEVMPSMFWCHWRCSLNLLQRERWTLADFNNAANERLKENDVLLIIGVQVLQQFVCLFFVFFERMCIKRRNQKKNAAGDTKVLLSVNRVVRCGILRGALIKSVHSNGRQKTVEKKITRNLSPVCSIEPLISVGLKLKTWASSERVLKQIAR